MTELKDLKLGTVVRARVPLWSEDGNEIVGSTMRTGRVLLEPHMEWVSIITPDGDHHSVHLSTVEIVARAPAKILKGLVSPEDDYARLSGHTDWIDRQGNEIDLPDSEYHHNFREEENTQHG